MKALIASVKKAMLLIGFSLIAITTFSQDISHILLEATTSDVTIRKYSFESKKMENFKAYYSLKHDKFLFDKTDYELYPDNEYYLVKARFKMFEVKGFNDNPDKSVTHIQIKYYYLKFNPETSETEEYMISSTNAGSYYPGLRMVKDVIQKDQGDIRFIIDETSEWVMQNTGKPNDVIFYIDQNTTIPSMTHIVMLSNLKRIIVNGKKVI